jgi:hypothetical protein
MIPARRDTLPQMASIAFTTYRHIEGGAPAAFACGWRMDMEAVPAAISVKSRPK